MNWERADFRVGLLLLAAFGLGAGTIVWVRSHATGTRYVTEFDAIGGLAAQAPVQMQGFAVGRVTDITPLLDSGHVRFRVGIRVEARLPDGALLPIGTGTHARIQQASILGNPVIVLEPPPTGSAPLRAGSTIPTTGSTNVVDEVQHLINEAGGQVSDALVRTAALVDSLQATLAVVRVAADRSALVAESTQVAVPRLVAGVNSAIAHTDSLVQEFRQVAPASRMLMDSISAVVPEVRAAARTAADAASDAGPTVRRIIANLDSTSLTLKAFSKQLSEHPFKTFFNGVKKP